jgi:hypothetical protein
MIVKVIFKIFLYSSAFIGLIRRREVKTPATVGEKTTITINIPLLIEFVTYFYSLFSIRITSSTKNLYFITGLIRNL